MPPIIHNLPFNAVKSDDIYLRRDDSSGPNKDLAYNLGSPALRWANIYAVNFTGIATSTLYADVAERFSCELATTPGTVVSIGGLHEITITAIELDTKVFGVISEKPGLALNSASGGSDTHPFVALSGRVPCFISGKAKKGQRLVSSKSSGAARVVPDEELSITSPYCVIGRALEDKDTEGVELLMIVVGVK